MNHRNMPRIVEKLLADDGKNIRPYFRIPMSADRDKRIWNRISKIEEDQKVERWISAFRKKAQGKIIDHDEPWLTLVALYGIFGRQSDINNSERLAMFNGLLSEVFANRHDGPEPPQFDSLEGIHLEVKLPEILRYREYLHFTVFQEGVYHLYPDIKRTLETKVKKAKASFEGNTNLDVLISGKTGGRYIHIFIQAKFMSDISQHTTYVPVRNQIARTIDCAIDLTTRGGEDLDGLRDFCFLLLTPGIFRNVWYGGPAASPFAPFVPEGSRFYCQKMCDYLDATMLSRDLPHWDGILRKEDWELICSRIGWLTFEEIVEKVMSSEILDGDDVEDYRSFFIERCMAR